MNAIWSGPEIVIPDVQVRPQRISMQKVTMPEKETALEYVLAQLDPQGPAYVQAKRDGNVERQLRLTSDDN